MRKHLLAQVLALALIAAPAAAQQGTVTIPSVGPGGVATLGPAVQELGRDCVIVDIATFVNRIHVHCVVSSGGINNGLYSRDYQPPPQPDRNVVYFAVGTASDPGLSDRVLRLATSAAQLNKPVHIFYRTDPAENPPGCLPADCRKLTGLVVLLQ
jgi:hypothetical protein